MTVLDEDDFVAGLANAVIRLSECETPAKTAYEPVVQQAYNHFVLRTLSRSSYKTPGSVPEMIDLIAGRPIGEWLPGSDSNDVLVHADTRTPSGVCLDLRYRNSDPIGESFENRIISRVFDACQEAESPATYEAFRRLLIEKPAMLRSTMDREFGDVILVPVGDILRECFQRAPATLRRGDRYALCADCRSLLVPLDHDDRWRCVMDRCHVKDANPVGELLDASEPVFQLKLPLRAYITGPGLFEVQLEEQMKALGLPVEMWPNYDAVDLLITFPDNVRWAVDVKDYAHPGVLGHRFKRFPSKPSHDAAFLVVPEYRFKADRGYARRFAHGRELAGRGSDTVPIPDSHFVNKVKAKLARYASPNPAAGGHGA